MPGNDRTPDPAAATQTGPDPIAAGPFELFVLVLSFVALALLAARVLLDLPAHVVESLGHVDSVICLAFLADFVVVLWRAPNRLRYLATRGWIDLASSIPMLRILRWGRLLRAIEIARLAHANEKSGALGRSMRQKLPSTVFWGTLSVSLLLLIGASLTIIEVERGHGGNIRTGEDAIWWSIVTMTTVGYGDLYPKTLAGRAMAVILMTVGVGIFGTFTSYIGARLTRSSHDDLTAEIGNLRQEIERLQQTISELAAKNTPPDERP